MSIALLIDSTVRANYVGITLKLADAILAHPVALTYSFLGLSILLIFLRFSIYHIRLRFIDRTTNEVEKDVAQRREQQNDPEAVTRSPLSYQQSSAASSSSSSLHCADGRCRGSHSMRSHQDEEDEDSQDMEHLVSDYTSGGWKNVLKVCCSPIAPSRLGNLRKILPVARFVQRHVNPQQCPHIVELYANQLRAPRHPDQINLPNNRSIDHPGNGSSSNYSNSSRVPNLEVELARTPNTGFVGVASRVDHLENNEEEDEDDDDADDDEEDGLFSERGSDEEKEEAPVNTLSGALSSSIFDVVSAVSSSLSMHVSLSDPLLFQSPTANPSATVDTDVENHSANLTARSSFYISGEDAEDSSARAPHIVLDGESSRSTVFHVDNI